MNLYFIRHARQLDTTEPSDLDCDGAENQDLSEEGLTQAATLASRLVRDELAFDAILASPLKRAHKTAEIVAKALSLPVTLDERLKEFRLVVPPRSGMDFVVDAWARARRDVNRPSTPGSESLSEFHARVSATVDAFREPFENRNILVFTHGGVIESAFIHWMRISLERSREIYPQVSCTSITHWQPFEDDGVKGWKLLTFNDTHHLRSEKARS